MKKLLTIFSVLLLVFGICACGSKNNDGGNGSINPRVEYKTIDELIEASGLKLNFPIDEATNIVYAIINNEVTEIQYTHDGNDYVYRASKTLSGPKDLGGIQGEPTKVEEKEYKLSTYNEGLVASWSTSDGTNYTLYSKTADVEKMDLEVLRTRGAGNEDIGGMSTTNANVINPMTSHESLEELNTATGLNLVFNVEGATDITYTSIDNKVAQIDFTLDGNKYTLRASKEASGYKDLAGYHYDKADSETVQIPATIYEFKEAKALVACWASGGLNYSLSSEGNKTEVFSNTLSKVAI